MGKVGDFVSTQIDGNKVYGKVSKIMQLTNSPGYNVDIKLNSNGKPVSTEYTFCALEVQPENKWLDDRVAALKAETVRLELLRNIK